MQCFAVVFFLPSRCVNSLIWSKGSTEKKPAVRTSSTRRQPAWKISSKVDTREARVRSGSRVLARPGELARSLNRKWFAARFFDQRQTFIIATPQETLKSEIAQRVLLEMSVFSRHVQTTFFLQTLWFREWTFRAEKRSAHPLSQAQGGLFCVFTIFTVFVCLLLEFWVKCTRCQSLLLHFYLTCLLFFVAWKLLWIQNNQC